MLEIYDAVMDKIFAFVSPVAGECPVCAFFRGAALGCLATGAGVLLARMAAGNA